MDRGSETQLQVTGNLNWTGQCSKGQNTISNCTQIWMVEPVVLTEIPNLINNMLYYRPSDMKGCFWHCKKWQIHPFISKGTLLLFKKSLIESTMWKITPGHTQLHLCVFFTCLATLSLQNKLVWLQLLFTYENVPVCLLTCVFSIHIFNGNCVFSVCIYTHTTIPVSLLRCVLFRVIFVSKYKWSSPSLCYLEKVNCK